MKERPILFSGPMVRAFLEDHKTQTRRVVKEYIPPNIEQSFPFNRVKNGILTFHATEDDFPMWGKHLVCPYGEIGDRLWVRETHIRRGDRAIYRADHDPIEAAGLGGMYGGWKPSIFMFRKHSRITLEITNVRVQRLQEITEEDAQAEGALFHDGGGIGHSGWRHDINHGFVYANARTSFAKLWDSLNAKRGFGWNENPWLWALTLRRVKEGA
jgi:hypothetical protein